MSSLNFHSGKRLFTESELVGEEYLRFFDVTSEIHGEIVSVYSRAINILYGERGLLVSIVKEMDQMSSLSLFVPGLFELPRRVIQRFVGAPVVMSREQVWLKDENERKVKIDCEKKWNGRVNFDPVKFGMKHEFLRKGRIGYLGNILLSVAKWDGLVPIVAALFFGYAGGDYDRYVGYAVEYLRGVEAQVRRKGINTLNLSGLVGLGMGFTPSGDDFITGALLASSLFRGMEVDRNSIEQRLDSTSYGGKTLLWQAMRGQFPFYLISGIGKLINLVESIRGKLWDFSNGVQGEFRRVIGRLISHGSTSGADAFTGFLWYLRLQGSSLHEESGHT